MRCAVCLKKNVTGNGKTCASVACKNLIKEYETLYARRNISFRKILSSQKLTLKHLEKSIAKYEIFCRIYEKSD